MASYALVDRLLAESARLEGEDPERSAELSGQALHGLEACRRRRLSGLRERKVLALGGPRPGALPNDMDMLVGRYRPSNPPPFVPPRRLRTSRTRSGERRSSGASRTAPGRRGRGLGAERSIGVLEDGLEDGGVEDTVGPTVEGVHVGAVDKVDGPGRTRVLVPVAALAGKGQVGHLVRTSTIMRPDVLYGKGIGGKRLLTATVLAAPRRTLSYRGFLSGRKAGSRHRP